MPIKTDAPKARLNVPMSPALMKKVQRAAKQNGQKVAAWVRDIIAKATADKKAGIPPKTKPTDVRQLTLRRVAERTGALAPKNSAPEKGALS